MRLLLVRAGEWDSRLPLDWLHWGVISYCMAEPKKVMLMSSIYSGYARKWFWFKPREIGLVYILVSVN